MSNTRVISAKSVEGIVSPRNFITNPNAFLNLSGWVADAGLTLSRSTSNILRGDANFQVIKPASNQQNQTVHFDFTIDREFIGQKLDVNFIAELISGTYSNDVKVIIKNLTDSSEQDLGFLDLSATFKRFNGSFTCSSNVSHLTYSLILRVFTTSSIAYTFNFSDVSVGARDLSIDVATGTLSATLSGHISASSGVHGVVGSVVGTTDNQILTNKTIDSNSNTISNIANAQVKAAAGIVESKLTLDYPTATLNTNINTHIGLSSGVHGVTGSVVGTSDAQVLTNKDIDGGTAANNHRITVPKDTLINLNSLTRKEGTVVYATDSKKAYVDNGSALLPIGSGVLNDPGYLNIITAADLNTVSDIPLSGQNAAFDGGGSISGSLTLSTTAADLMFASKVIKYSNSSANKQNDYFGWSYTLPQNLATNGGVTVAFEFFYKTSSLVATNDFRFAVKIVGGTMDGIIQTMNLDASSNTKMAQMLFNIPQDCTSLSYGFQLTSASTNLLNLFCDRILVTANAFGKANLYTNEYVGYSGYLSGTSGGLKLKTKDAISNNSSIISDDNSGSYTKFTVLRKSYVTVSAAITLNSLSTPSCNIWYYNSAGTVLRQINMQSTAWNQTGAFSTVAAPGDYFFISNSGSSNDSVTTNFQITAIAESPAVLVQGSAGSDWTAYTPTFQGFGTPTGVECFWRKNGSNIDLRCKFTSGTATSVEARVGLPGGYTSADTTKIPSVSIAGAVARSTSSLNLYNNIALIEPNVTYITFGEQLNNLANITKISDAAGYFGTGLTLSFFASVPIQGLSSVTTVALPAGKVNDFSAIIGNNGTASIVSQGPTQFIQSVSRTSTGVVAITFVPGFFTVAPSVVVSSETYMQFNTTVTTSGFSAYLRTNTGTLEDDNLQIHVSRQGSDASTGSVYVGNVTPEQVCRISDQKASGTNGGTFTSGSWQTRTLNTVEGDTSFVTLSANQITLPPGKYNIFAKAPGYVIGFNKAKLYSITDSADVIMGTSEYSVASVTNASTLSGTLNLSATKTYELRHYCTTTGSSNGFGQSAVTGGTVEVFSDILITKLY